MDWILIMGMFCSPANLADAKPETKAKCEKLFTECTDKVEAAAIKAKRDLDRSDAAMFCLKSAL